VDLTSDTANCVYCGNVCAVTLQPYICRPPDSIPTCTKDVGCGFKCLTPGQVRCGPECVDLGGDPRNCGTRCAPGTVYQNGECVCQQPGTVPYGGSCEELDEVPVCAGW
jgi:hypothetical protein